MSQYKRRTSISGQPPSKTGFFTVDRAAFRAAVGLGLNAAIAHLVMARGTARDNRTTQWSVNAIEQRTGISRPRALKAVNDLLLRGIWVKTRSGKHPIYKSVVGNEIPGGPFNELEQRALDAVYKSIPAPPECRGAFQVLKAKGLVFENGDSPKSVDGALADYTRPLQIWLPNSLIDGAADEIPPIELVRQTRSLTALHLLIELYEAQFLPHHGGAPRDLLRIAHDREKIGEQGPFVVWGFRRQKMYADLSWSRLFFTDGTRGNNDGASDLDWDEFWSALIVLEDLGLVEWVGMLLDGDDHEAEIIHPCGLCGGEQEEQDLASSAARAARAMLTPAQYKWATENGYTTALPVRHHISRVALVEVLRLKYRPHTKATAAWFAGMKETTSSYLDRYKIMAETACRKSSAA